MLEIILSLFLTWGIGLFLPLLLRYVFLKRPVRNRTAWIFAIINWVIILTIFLLLGSKSKSHNATIVISYVAYLILHKGYKNKGYKKIETKE